MSEESQNNSKPEDAPGFSPDEHGKSEEVIGNDKLPMTNDKALDSSQQPVIESTPTAPIQEPVREEVVTPILPESAPMSVPPPKSVKYFLTLALEAI